MEGIEGFIEFAESKGFQLTDPKPTGELIRFANQGESRENSWYICWKHRNHVIAQIGSWKTGKSYQYSSSNKISKEDKEKLRAELTRARNRYNAEKLNRQKEAAAKAHHLWKEAVHLTDAAYLKKKGLPHTFGAKFKKGNGAILVPMRGIDGTLHGLQMIFEDGTKRFLKGQKVSRTFFFIGKEIDTEKPVCVCEGYATGATIHLATGYPVFCAFSADNMVKVARALKRKYPEFKLLICGDNDRNTEGNPGLTAMEKAAKSVNGIYVYPEFNGDEGTDFNDLMQQEDLSAVKEQILTALDPSPMPTELGKNKTSHQYTRQDNNEKSKKERNTHFMFLPLGFDNKTHFFYVNDSYSVVSINSYSETEILKLAPLSYWEGLYANDSGKLKVSEIKDDLIRMIHKKGLFDKSKVRATGVWIDRCHVVVNTGTKLYVNGRLTGYNDFKSAFIYIRSIFKIDYNPGRKPLSKEDGHLLVDICKEFHWENNRSAYLLAGWIAIARIAGALKIRPHIWLTGGSGTGKSTVMNDLIEPCLGFKGSRLFFQGGSTEAGIRQTVSHNAIPIIFDEFETNDEQTKLRYLAIIELFRQSWSSTGGKIAKGTAEGKALDFDLSFAVLVSSIRVMIQNDADLSRFSICELKPHGNDEVHWEALEQKLNKLDEDFGERIFLRSCALIETINLSYKTLKRVISQKVSQRCGQQYGMLLAGFYSLISDEPISLQFAEHLVDQMNLNSEDMQEDRTTDEMKCLEHLLTSKVSYTDIHGCTHTNNTVIELLKEPNEMKYKGLRNIGVVVESEYILVANQHTELKKIFSGTQWVDWKRSLKRLPGTFSKKTTTTFGSKVSRSTVIPKKVFF